MKKSLLNTCVLLLVCLAIHSSAQELLVGGNMEAGEHWKIINYKAEAAEYEFNFIGATPTEGKDGCLEVTASGTNETDIIFYQPLILVGGEQYEFTGAFKDMGGTIANFWCEALYDTLAPPDSGDFGGSIIVGFNTWNGTLPAVDGTFQDDFTKGSGNIFTAPGEAGVLDTVYFVINIGCYMGGTSNYFFDVAVDELSIKKVASTTISDNFISRENWLKQNYPNPFNPLTNIFYFLKENTIVTLKVFDIMGREVVSLLNNEYQTEGQHFICFNAAAIPSGIYFYKLLTDKFADIKKMTVLK